jgi:hypothetical protein
MTDWTKPPQYVGGVLDLRLPTDPPGELPIAELDARMAEYMRQRRAGCRDHSDFADSLARAPEVFAELEAPAPAATIGPELAPPSAPVGSPRQP